MQKNIVILSTLDTKSNECEYLRDRITERGHRAIVVDLSARDFQTGLKPDISCRDVARAAGFGYEKVSKLDRRKATDIMVSGARVILGRMQREGKLDALIGMGGTNGTSMECELMRGFPMGLPKLMISTVASGNVRSYVGATDIVMMHSVADITLNSFMKGVLGRAAGAIVGMAESERITSEGQLVIGASMYGVTTPCVLRVKSKLEEEGFDIVVFHSVGTGGMALGQMIHEGLIKGVVDITTHEVADELFGGIFSAGPERLNAATESGIPQVLVPGALDIVNFAGPSSIPRVFSKRAFLRYTPETTNMRTNKAENRKLGEFFAERLNHSPRRVVVLVPLRGFSAQDREGGVMAVDYGGKPSKPWFDPDADLAFCKALETNADPRRVEVRKLDLHINDPDFADQVASAFKEQWDSGQRKPSK